MKQRICKKCLMSDLSEDDFFHNQQMYIKQIDPHIKTDDIEYERRLSICKECDHLLYGMCRVCGCFVEMRAAISKNYCPGIDKNW